jgi:ATP-dependent Lon protease
MNRPQVEENVFILALREQVVFPNIRTSIGLRQRTFEQLCEHCERHHTNDIACITMTPGKNKDEDLYEVGTLCKLISHSQSSSTRSGNKDDTITIIAVEGKSRFKIRSFDQTQPYRTATIELVNQKEEGDNGTVEVKALMNSVQQSLLKHLKDSNLMQGGGNQKQSASGLSALLDGKRIQWPNSGSLLADMVGAGLGQLTTAERQEVLASIPVRARLELVLDLLNKVGEAHRISKEINNNISAKTEEQFREAVLQRQMQEIQKELRKLKTGKKSSNEDDSAADAASDGDYEDEQDEEEDEIAALKQSLSKAGLSAEAQTIAKRELRRLQNIQPQHPEYMVCRTYLETLAGLPWNTSSDGEQNLDLNKAREIMDADHNGLQVVKRRILEFLAVHKMRGDMKGPILCLHGPPGVGKTSLGKSIAKALGRQFHRVALGGVRDEAELRGHRRTYIGSMPGVIIQSLATSKVNNPVVLLDEIDKLSNSHMGNPSGALLEVLDPEQNNTFKDNYLNCAFDLSKILFICTCNDLHTIDRPLLDRMEVIDLSGYTIEEKVAIAQRHLIPKQLKLHALHRKLTQAPETPIEIEEATEWNMSGPVLTPAKPEAEDEKKEEEDLGEPLLMLKDAAITDLVAKWTTESGVRSLERKIAEVCRWAALRSLSGSGSHLAVGANKEKEEEKERALAECGPDGNGVIMVDSKHLPHIVGVEIFEPEIAERLTVGVAMGLAVTSTGGHLLFIEATRHKGNGRLTVTGQLGDVMRESVMAAVTLLKSKTPTPPKTESMEGDKDLSDMPSLSPLNESIPSPAMASWGKIVPIPRSLDSHRRSPIQLGFSDESKDSYNPSEQVTKQVQTLFSCLDEKSAFGSDDVHIHFPAGGIPKDGPSAGVAATLALASLLFNRPVRSDTAVTGEITLRGHVLPVGGIKDKVLAAHRAGVRHVLIPYANMRHAVNDLPSSVAKEIEVHYVKHIDEALYWMFSEESSSNVQPLLSKL